VDSSRATFEFLNVAASTQCASVAIFAHVVDLARSPLLCEERLERSVEAQDRDPALAGQGLDPVAALGSVKLGGLKYNVVEPSAFGPVAGDGMALTV
jgi:hypothetical protein